MAFVPIVSCPESLSLEHGKASIVGKIFQPRFIPFGHELQAAVFLTLPESDYNRNLGIFQVNDGIVLPDNAFLYLTAIEDAEYKDDKIVFWNNVYGFDMSCIRKQSIMEPLVDMVDQNQIVTNCQLLKTMDFSNMTSVDLDEIREEWTNYVTNFIYRS